VLDTAASLLNTRPTQPGTDLLNSITIAQRYLSNYPTAAKTLVVFSDMFQQTSEIDFTTGDMGALQKLLVTAAPKSSVPNLRNVDVYAVGAGLNGGSVDPTRNLAIERFWIAFFKRAGATFPASQYGTRLIRFED